MVGLRERERELELVSSFEEERFSEMCVARPFESTERFSGVTEWLQPMLQALTKFYSGRAWAAGDTRHMAYRS